MSLLSSSTNEQEPPRFGERCTEIAEETPQRFFTPILDIVLSPNMQQCEQL